jgi:hypothetical protein
MGENQISGENQRHPKQNNPEQVQEKTKHVHGRIRAGGMHSAAPLVLRMPPGKSLPKNRRGKPQVAASINRTNQL